MGFRNAFLSLTTRLVFRLILTASLLAGVQIGAAQDTVDYCQLAESDLPTDTEVTEGHAGWLINHAGDLVLGIDSDQDNNPNVAYRFASLNSQTFGELVNSWPDGSPVSIVLSSNIRTAYVDIAFEFSNRSTTFFTNPFDCTNLRYSSSAIEDAALAFNKLPMGEVAAKNAFKNLVGRPLVRKQITTSKTQESDDQSTEGVFYCVAGGPGASQCSISFGGIGAIAGGSCMVACPHPNEYACCGPGFPENCECVASDQGGGGGGDLPPMIPDSGDDDDGDEDDEEEDTQSIGGPR